MSNTNLNVRMKQLYKTKAQWEQLNPVLLAGECAYNTDNNQYKIGDGIKTWNQLEYVRDTQTKTDLENLESSLGNLAYKSSASGNYTPQGTISKPILIVGSIEKNISALSSVGTLPTLTYDANTESLTFEQGTLPKEGYQTINYVESVEVAGAPTFTGAATTVTVE